VPRHRSRPTSISAAQHWQPDTGSTPVPQLAPHPFLYISNRRRGTLHCHRSGQMAPGSPSFAFPSRYRCHSSPPSLFSPRALSRAHQDSPTTPSRFAGLFNTSHRTVSPSPDPSIAGSSVLGPDAARLRPHHAPKQPALHRHAMRHHPRGFSGWSPTTSVCLVVGPTCHSRRPPRHCLPATPTSPFSGCQQFFFSGCPRGGGIPCLISPGPFTVSRASNANVVSVRSA
jgi:hypothetical protein